MNYVQITHIDNGIIHLSGSQEKMDSKLNASLAKELRNITGESWEINISTNSDTLSLKDQLIENFLQTDSYQEIQKLFPAAKLTDIIMLRKT